MDELVELVAKKAGISNSQAKKAVDTVLDFLGDKLPEPYGSHLDKVVEGDLPTGSVDDITKGLGGLFGKK